MPDSSPPVASTAARSETSSPTTFEGQGSATSSPGSACGHTLCASLAGPTICQFGPALVPANRSALPASAAVSTTIGTSGRYGSISSASAALQLSLESRLRARTASRGSTLFALIWKERVTPGGGGDLCAAGVGAPHIRQRLYFVAVAYPDADGWGKRWRAERSRLVDGLAASRSSAALGGQARVVADSESDRRIQGRRYEQQRAGFAEDGIVGDSAGIGRSARSDLDSIGQRSAVISAAGDGELGDAGCSRGRRNAGAVSCAEREGDCERRLVGSIDHQPLDAGAASGLADANLINAIDGHESRGGRLVQPASYETPVRNPWSPCDWIPCTDGKSRPVEPGTFPLAHGAPSRVGRLRAYGNAIVSEVAATFIEAVTDVLDGWFA